MWEVLYKRNILYISIQQKNGDWNFLENCRHLNSMSVHGMNFTIHKQMDALTLCMNIYEYEQ